MPAMMMMVMAMMMMRAMVMMTTPVEKHDTANEVETEEHWQTEGHIHRHPLIDFCHDYAEHDICDDYDYDYLIHDHVDDLCCLLESQSCPRDWTVWLSRGSKT